MRAKLLSFLLLLTCCLSAHEPLKENVVIPCENGLEMFEWALDFIRNAERSIEFVPCFPGGKIMHRALDAIEQRLEERPDLQVYYLCAWLCMESEDSDRLNSLKARYPRNFHQAYAFNILKLVPHYATIDNHVKCLVVDETYFTVGGTNFDEAFCTDGSYTPKRLPQAHREKGPAAARDSDIVGRGPLAKELRQMIFAIFSLWENYEQKGYSRFEPDPVHTRHCNHYVAHEEGFRGWTPRFEESPSKVTVANIQMIFGAPTQYPHNRITQAYCKLLEGAKEEVVIGNLYFTPVPPLYQKLIQTANRGVALSIHTNGSSGTTPTMTDYFAWGGRISYLPMLFGREFASNERMLLPRLKPNAVQIYEYAVPDVLYHKKIMVVDRRYTILGSYNFGLKSHYTDYELTVVIDSEEVANYFLKVFEKDESLSTRVSQEEMAEWYFNPWIYCKGKSQKNVLAIF